MPGSAPFWRARSMPRRLRSDLSDRSLDPDREQLLAAFGRRRCGIADDAGRLKRERQIEPLEIDALRMRRHQFGRVDDAGVLPDIGPAFALAQQQGHLGGVGIIGVDMDDPDALAGPFGIEARRHRGLRGLAPAVIGNQAYGPEAAGFQAARYTLDHGGVDRL